MLKRLVSLALLLGVLFVGTVFVHAAGTVTVVKDQVFKQTSWSRPVRVISWQISSTSGTTPVSGSAATVTDVSGIVMGLLAVPGTSALAPDDDYDITIVDSSNGADILNGAGTDLPQSATSVENRRMPVDFLSDAPIVLFNETIYPVAANFNTADGASTTITLYIFLP